MIHSAPPLYRCQLALAATLSLLFAGCASHRVLELPERPAHSIANRQENRGITVSSLALITPESVERYFGEKLWSAGYFPVVVYVENRGESALEIQRDAFSLWLEESNGSTPAPKPVNHSLVLEDCKASRLPAYLLIPLLVFPAFWARSHIDDYNIELTKDIYAKALPPYFRLEKGDPPLRGTLFFRRPQGDILLQDALKSAELRIDAGLEGSPVTGSALLETGLSPESDEPPSRKVGERVNFILSLTGSQE